MKYRAHNAKRDANESEIVAILRGYGVSVYLLDQPLDLLCGFGGITRLAEVKMPRNKCGDPKGYTTDQDAFLNTWKGGHTLLVSEHDAHQFARQIKADARAGRVV